MSEYASYAEAVIVIAAADDAIQREHKRHEQEITAQRAKAADAKRWLHREAAGLDSAKIALARTVLDVDGWEKGGRDRFSVIEDAVFQLAHGEPSRDRTPGKRGGGYSSLWERYLATKNYAEWIGQREDNAYGYRPRHGTVVFRVGLKKPVRDRDPRELTPEEREAAIYLLINIERITAAENLEKAA